MGPLLPANIILGMQSRFGKLFRFLVKFVLIYLVTQIQGGAMSLPDTSSSVWKI